MRTLLENDGMTQRQLAQAMSSDPNTVAALLERMEGAELVERRPHEKDRRAHRLTLTKAGRGKYFKGRALAVAMQAEVLSALTENEREAFLEQLEKVAEACRQAAEQPPKSRR
jgi:DNA-binding MarR family transcriptional regulator